MAMAGHGMEHGRTDGRHVHGDVFPALGMFVGVGATLGLAAVLTLAAAGVGDRQNLWKESVLGAAVGGILGLFVGLSCAVWRPGAILPTQPRRSEPPVQLWDPWLDSGREGEWTEPEAAAEEPAIPVPRTRELPTTRAAVRPRVLSPDTHEAVLLEDEIGSLIQKGERGVVQIIGGPGSGKSTALKHLAAVLPPWALERVRLVEESDVVVDDPGCCDLIVSTAFPCLSQGLWRFIRWLAGGRTT